MHTLNPSDKRRDSSQEPGKNAVNRNIFGNSKSKMWTADELSFMFGETEV
jgi:hypothetical protein